MSNRRSTSIRWTEPVILHGLAVGAAGILMTLLIEAGVQADGSGRYGCYVGAVAVFLLGCHHIAEARRQVTPVARPDGGTGAELVHEIAVQAVKAVIETTYPTLSQVKSSVQGGIIDPGELGGPS